jgi:hypothetical protein
MVNATAPTTIPRVDVATSCTPLKAAVTRRLPNATDGAAENTPANRLGTSVWASAANASTNRPPANAFNAVVHARTPLRIVLNRSDRYLHMAVRDRNPHLPVPVVGGLDDPVRDGGRGLALVETFASGWGAMPTGDGKAVWATLSIRSTIDLDRWSTGSGDRPDMG